MSNNKLLKLKQINYEVTSIKTTCLNDIGLFAKSIYIKLKFQLSKNITKTKKANIVNIKIRTSKHNFKYLNNKGDNVGFFHSVW